ncbi:MAG: adenosine deaminase [Oscillospiraceae bacterium]|nr:adenosine deaminase [Oscillospiraceae bacterium]
MYQGKVDLHLHLDGSLSESVITELLARDGRTMPLKEIHDAIRVPDHCASLVEYLKRFELPTQVLQTEYAMELAAYDLVSRLAELGLIYAEIRFAPQLHTRRGLTQEAVLKSTIRGVRQAQEDFPTIRAGLVLCSMIGGKGNDETARLAMQYVGNGVAGADLAGAEGMVPIEEYYDLFHELQRENVPFTIHAGECGDPENVRKAIELGARRVGHGCGAIKSEAVMDLLVRTQTVVEACVVSNLQTKAVLDAKDHPIRPFFDRGIAVTVNTDNMSCSNTTLQREHEVIAGAMHFTDAEFLQMDKNAINGAFIPENEKKELLKKLA